MILSRLAPIMKKYVCAACRHKRAKCKADCLLAPYFLNHMPQQYFIALKVFDESRLKKLLKSLNPDQRSTTMKHAIEEAKLCHIADPVSGSHGLIKKLEHEIAREEEEVSRVSCLLSVCRGGGGGINADVLARLGNAAGVGEKDTLLFKEVLYRSNNKIASLLMDIFLHFIDWNSKLNNI